MARLRESVYHAEPSASAASPSGSRFSLPLATFSILPSFNRPMASDISMVNHTAPSRATAMLTGMSVLAGIRCSTNPESAHGPRCPISARPSASSTTLAAAASQSRGRRIASTERRASHRLDRQGLPSLPAGEVEPVRGGTRSYEALNRRTAATDASSRRIRNAAPPTRFVAPSRESALRPRRLAARARDRAEGESGVDGRRARRIAHERSGLEMRGELVALGLPLLAAVRAPVQAAVGRQEDDRTHDGQAAHRWPRVRKWPADGLPSLAPIVAPEQLAAHDDPEPIGFGVVQVHRLDPSGRRRRGTWAPAAGPLGAGPQSTASDRVYDVRVASSDEHGLDRVSGKSIARVLPGRARVVAHVKAAPARQVDAPGSRASSQRPRRSSTGRRASGLPPITVAPEDRRASETRARAFRPHRKPPQRPRRQHVRRFHRPVAPTVLRREHAAVSRHQEMVRRAWG